VPSPAHGGTTAAELHGRNDPIKRTCGTPEEPAAARRGERGTALVEFALFFPLVALICLGMVDLGRAYMTVNQVKNAAREGATHAQTHPLALAGTDCTIPDSAQWHARNEAGSGGASLDVAVSTPNGVFESSDLGCAPSSAAAVSGDDITVTVSKPFTILTPLLRAVTGNPTIRSSVTVRVQ
jgi:Flp pilus assembly protein TadG